MEEYTPILPFEVLSRKLGRRPGEIIKLDANENPYGLSPAMRQALAEFPYYHIYPDPQQEELRAALEVYTGVDRQHILPGHGADELIDYLCRLFLRPGDAIIDCPPTFGMYSFDAGLAGACVVRVWRRADFSIDVEGIEAAAHAQPEKTRLLFLTSPNNPDGGLLNQADLARLLRLPLVVVVDEAYIEFGGESVAKWVPDHAKLVVLRTFSKWAGMAGLRLGYGIFPTGIIQHLWKFKQPYNVNVAASVAGLAALRDLDHIGPTIAALTRERARLARELARFDYLEPLPSHTNFVLCKVVGRSAAELKQALERRGILVRYFAKPGVDNYIRVSAGKPEHTDALLAALTELQ